MEERYITERMLADAETIYENHFRSWQPNQWWCYDSWEAQGDGEGEGRATTPNDGRIIMWVYRLRSDEWQVGYYTPDKEWTQDSAWNTKEQAAERVHWLNGGNYP